MKDIKQIVSESLGMIQKIDLGNTSFEKLIQIHLRKLINEVRVASNSGNPGLPDMYISDIDGMAYIKEDRDNLLGVVIHPDNDIISVTLCNVINGDDCIHSIGMDGLKYTEALNIITKIH